VAIERTILKDETWFKITNYDAMRPFFMNVVSDSNHWMFISSNGGLSAGRKNSQYALFPYYTDDKITESAEITGSKSIFQIRSGGGVQVWEPFGVRNSGHFTLRRNLYKNRAGNKIMFEEVNVDLRLTFRYEWNSSNLYGFVRKSELINDGDAVCEVTVLDGIQNIMPYGVEPDMQVRASNLADAYKRSELIAESGLGIYALSAIIVDKAEPSEALKANVAWSLGLPGAQYLLSSLQLDVFRSGGMPTPEVDVKGEKGAYFVMAPLRLEGKTSQRWKIVANVNQQQAQVIALSKEICDQTQLDDILEQDIARGTQQLVALVAASDGLRFSADPLKDTRHYANVLFNIMRGGTFDDNYQIEKWDLLSYMEKANREVFHRNRAQLESLPEVFDVSVLYEVISSLSDPDFYRLCKEYLPLKFSRRHGDPSRPWNQFSINTNSEVDGSKILDYEGNWRDIFQNWEALVHAYPGFIEGMIFKFLNASTFDGYNPYRVTKGGFDWETIEPDNPWSYIGYWGDHQIIYLLKFLEFYSQHSPEALESLFRADYFVYAHVPYRIKSYADIARDPKNTIDFDEPADHAIRALVSSLGADGALLRTGSGDIHRVNFLEKILATVLSKISNLIPEGGIWMNTQRPEWNDANNALVGNGVSMVTLYYLRRFLRFFAGLLSQASDTAIPVSQELSAMFVRLSRVLTDHSHLLGSSINDADRKRITDALGQAGSDFRQSVYENGFSGAKAELSVGDIRRFTEIALQYLEHAIEANRREDDLYHAYNIMSMNEDGITLGHLSEMLEGQVAVLSSGYLSTEASIRVLNAMRSSDLYRADQNSYMLYPNKALPGFLQKNNIPATSIHRSSLLQAMLKDGNTALVSADVQGGYHFNGNFRNARDLKTALQALAETPYAGLAAQDTSTILAIFEEVFNHKAFTGRSGTFYAYEGLGSIYWHMVSKLHLAVLEVCLQAVSESDAALTPELFSHYQEIGAGIGVHKSPELYGAFPTDPYSHTPLHRGAQQPGMTGQVKEDILVSLGELGIQIRAGKLSFNPQLLRKAEFTTEPRTVRLVSLTGASTERELSAGSLCFTYCQVPVVYQIADADGINITRTDGTVTQVSGTLSLDAKLSHAVFARTGEISLITVNLREGHLR